MNSPAMAAAAVVCRGLRMRMGDGVAVAARDVVVLGRTWAALPLRR
jgi:hypothetical protein